MSFSLSRVPGRRAALVGLAIGVAAGVVIAGRAPPADPNAPREQDGHVVPRLDEASYDRIARRMDADAALPPLLATCPADAWRRRGDLGHNGPVAETTCAKAPDTCLADCLEFSRRNACFALARVMERTRDALPAQTLFALACASGGSGGCVNRAGGLRNGTTKDDPFPKDRAARQACQLRSFTLACDDDGAWGCAMRGQAYQEGEGTPPDAAAARRDYAKACALDPKFAACTFAKARRAEMDDAETAKEKGR